MEPGRFQSLTRSVSSRLSRRAALQASGLGLAAGVMATTSRVATAQDATPDPLSDDAMFLFVQSATSGTFSPNRDAGTPTVDSTPAPGGGADYLLTLEGHTGSTVYFSDRPERIFGEAPTRRFLDGLGFDISDPPNAALVTNDADGNEDILVVELIDPGYDADAGTITYGVNILSDYEGGLDFAARRQQNEDLAPTFGAASLFIDDCPDANPLNCYNACFTDPVGNLGERGMCWKWSDFACEPCSGGFDGTAQECNDQFSACGGNCFTDAANCDAGP
jgi:hypothetical protein